MKARCDREALLSALQIVGPVVPARSPKPILQTVRIVAGKSETLLEATDLEVGVRAHVRGVEADKAGQALVPAARLMSILREAQDEAVTLDASPDKTVVQGKQFRFELPGGNPAEFPGVPAFEASDCYVLPARLIRELIRRTSFAVGAESTRYALTGVLWDVEGETLRMVGTDSRRLALAQGHIGVQGSPKPAAAPPVVPKKTLDLVERLVEDDDTEVLVALGSGDVRVRSERASVYSPLVAGRFPKYQDVIPRDFSASATAVAGPLLGAVRQASIVTSEDSRRVDFEFSERQLTLRSRAPDVGESKIEMPLEYSGPGLTIGFDPRFIADFLRVLAPETSVRVDLIDSESAAVFRVESDYSYVVMPLASER